MSLSFHDEVWVDNRDMLRRRGYNLNVCGLFFHEGFIEIRSGSGLRALISRRVYSKLTMFHAFFMRSDGLEATLMTENTFDRGTYVHHLRQFALSGSS